MAEEGDECHRGHRPRAPEIEELFVCVGGRAVITRLTSYVVDLNAGIAAEPELSILGAVEVREALAQHRNSLWGAQ